MKGFGFPAPSVLNGQMKMHLNQKTKEESLDPEWLKTHTKVSITQREEVKSDQ
jgi:hypothetical protein